MRVQQNQKKERTIQSDDDMYKGINVWYGAVSVAREKGDDYSERNRLMNPDVGYKRVHRHSFVHIPRSLHKNPHKRYCFCSPLLYFCQHHKKSFSYKYLLLLGRRQTSTEP